LYGSIAASGRQELEYTFKIPGAGILVS